MRLAGLDERLITGDADPWDRFSAWAATVPRLIRNPLYVWSHLELRRVFGIDLELNPATAREIWEEANRQLPDWTTREAPLALRRQSGRDHRRPGGRPRRSSTARRATRRAEGDDDSDVPPGRRASAARRSTGLEHVDRSPGSGDRERRSTTCPHCSPRSPVRTRTSRSWVDVRATTASSPYPTFPLTRPSRTP